LAQPFDANSLQTIGDAFPVADRVYYGRLTNKTSFSVSQNGILVYRTRASSTGALLTWFDRNGKKAASISPSAMYFDLSLSPDGKRIAASRIDSRNLDIWLYEISRAVWTRFTFDPATERWPSWSSDGSTILFASDRNKSWDLFQRASSGARSEELLLESVGSGSDWSLDGRFIAYDAGDPQTGWDIWILPMNPDPQGASGDRKPFLFLQTEFDESRPAFSPDGRWIAYQSNESGRWEIYIRPFPGPGGKWQVSTNGGSWAHWRGEIGRASCRERV
jgi:Tol biopolymer transport system component